MNLFLILKEWIPTKYKHRIKYVGCYKFFNSFVYKNLEIEDQNFDTYLYTMRHVYRDKFSSPKSNVKCFLYVKNIETIHNHMPLTCLERNGTQLCFGHEVPTNQSYLLHFKKEIDIPFNCTERDLRKCAVFDPIIWKYHKRLKKNMEISLSEIFPNN